MDIIENQYGLYLSEIGDDAGALTMLRRSIDAYPDNAFAVHAYADRQLRTALQDGNFDKVAETLKPKRLLQALKALDSRDMLEADQYPIVTLATGQP